MARRILNRKELRADYDAAERRRRDEEDLDENDEDEDEDEAAESDNEAGDEDEEVDEEEAPKKKKKAAKDAKTKVKARTRSSKAARLKVVWGVFNNSNQRVATFDYPKRAEAEEKARQLTADKKSTHFVQPVKEPIEEKPD